MNQFVREAKGWAWLAALATLIVTPAIVISAYGFATSGDPLPGEYPIFGPAGAALLRGDWIHVFDSAAVQAGPFQLIVYGIPWLLGYDGVLHWVIFYSTVTVAVTVLFAFSVVATLKPRPGWSVLSVTVGAIALGCFGYFIPVAVFLGHPSQVVIPALWAIAAVSVRRNQYALAAVLVAVSAGWEMWGVLGAPIIFIVTHPRWGRAVVAGAVTLGIIYGPFLAFGNFSMFELIWPVRQQTVIALLFPGIESFPWGLRLVQAGLALAAGVGVARVSRNSHTRIWLTLVAIVGVRLLADPLVSGYYWIAAGVTALGLVAVCVQEKDWPVALLGAALAATAWVIPQPSAWATTVGVVLAATAVVLVAHRARRTLEAVEGPAESKRMGRSD
jgi:hypothetical protein